MLEGLRTVWPERNPREDPPELCVDHGGHADHHRHQHQPADQWPAGEGGDQAGGGGWGRGFIWVNRPQQNQRGMEQCCFFSVLFRLSYALRLLRWIIWPTTSKLHGALLFLARDLFKSAAFRLA